MNTSHQNGGAPDVFSKTAEARHVDFVEQNKRVVDCWTGNKPTCHLSDDQLRMLSSIQQAAEAIAGGAKRLANPEISQDAAEALFASHKYWHQRFTASSHRLFKELRDNAAGRRQLEIEGLK